MTVYEQSQEMGGANNGGGAGATKWAEPRNARMPSQWCDSVLIRKIINNFN